jgi:uncharacterized protein
MRPPATLPAIRHRSERAVVSAIPDRVSGVDQRRRALLRRGFLGIGVLATGRLWIGCGTSALDASLPPSGAREDQTGREPHRASPRRLDAGLDAPATPMRADAGMPPVRTDPNALGPAAIDAGNNVPGVDAEPGLSRPRSILAALGPLQAPDPNGLRLPAGFRSRVLARSSQRVTEGSSYVWHPAPDGGATFATIDGGFVYVSNCEFTPGGAGALRFDATGQLIDAYPILQNSTRNCAGGPTPWGTWLSCEEVSFGSVWECDPLGVRAAVLRPSLGQFRHEAAAVDPIRKQIYLTEDEPNGRLYRFTPDALDSAGRPDLQRGRLEVAAVRGGGLEGRLAWRAIADPSGAALPTRLQAEASTAFNGAEGIWHHEGVLYFATKGDNRVWAYDLGAQLLTLIYDLATADHPILSGVDNVTVSPAGDVLVAEDIGGDMQIVGLAPDGTQLALVQLIGHDGSEITGPAFDPSGTRLYFSSQRGSDGKPETGVTFEVTGRFFEPAS